MKKLWIGLSIILLSACSASLTINLKDAIVIEYGDEIKVESLTDDEGMTLKEIKNYDAKKVEKQTITAVFKKDDQTTEKKIEVDVKDTKSPEITLKEESITVTEANDFDATSNIESIKDPVDGDINLSEDTTILKNGYLVDSTIDVNTVGEYEVKVTAYDVNGNKSEKSYTVTVNDKEEEKEAKNATNNSDNSNTGNSGSNNNTVSNNGNSDNGESNSTVKPGGNSSGAANTPPTNDGNTSSSDSSNNTPPPSSGGGSSNNTPPPSNEKPILCPNGINPDRACDSIISGEGIPGNSGVWTSSEQEAIDAAHWGQDRNSQWYRMQSYIGETIYNDMRSMYTVVFY